MKGFFNFQRTPPFLVLDLGTEAAKSLIINMAPGENIDRGKNVVLAASLKYFEGESPFAVENLDEALIKKEISQALNELKQNLCFSLTAKDIKGQIYRQKKWEAVLSFPGDIFKVRVFSQSLWRENRNEKITKKEAERIKWQILRNIQKQAAQNLAETFGIFAEDIHWVSAKITQIKIDGYRVGDLAGFAGRNLDFKIILTFLPKYYFEKIKKALDELGLKIRRIVHPAENISKLPSQTGLLVDIGGAITGFFSIENGELSQAGEFKGGGQIFTRLLSEDLGLDKNSSRTLKEKYSAKTLSPGVLKKIKEIFIRGQRIWRENFKDAIIKSQLSQSAFPEIFLVGGGSLLPEMQSFFKEGQLQNAVSSVFPEGAEIKIIYPKDLKGIENATNNLKTPQFSPSLLLF